MARDLEEELRLAADANSQLRRDIVRLKQKLELQQLQAENRQLQHGLTFSVGKSGGVVVDGLGGFPTTLYKDQWARVIAAVPDLQRFIAEHDGTLITRAQSRERRPKKRRA